MAPFPMAALPSQGACRQPLHMCGFYIFVYFPGRKLCLGARVTAPPPAVLARVLAHLTRCSAAALGTGRAGYRQRWLPSRDQGSEQEAGRW